MDRLRQARMPGGLPVLDVALAAVLCVFAVGGLLTGQVHEHPLGVTLPVAALSTAAVALRSRFPLAVAVLVAGMAVAQALLTGSVSGTLWALVVFLVVAYTVGVECEEGTALLGLGAILACQFIGEWLTNGTDYPFDALVFGGAWLVGRGTRSWRTQATSAEQHQHDLARIAVVEERARIARELHDVVAHSLSVIAVQADAAEAALLKDPGRAVPPMRAIRGSAREALSDMRQLLHVLRADGDEAPDALMPPRGVADLPQLIANVRDSGMLLRAEVRPLGALSSGTDLAVYRIVQEGLTNARKHAREAPTTLRVERLGDELSIEVTNAPPSESRVSTTNSTGLGLIGIRERVHAAGGRIECGATALGGFRLAVWLPSHDVEEVTAP